MQGPELQGVVVTDDSAPSGTAPAARPRPTGWRRWALVVPPAILLLLKGAAQLAALVPIRLGDQPVIVPSALAALSILAALALLGGRRLGWLLALSIVGWDLGVSLLRWWLGRPDYVALGLLALTALLITSSPLRALYANGEER
jgi:hypothetical protein